MNKNQAVFSVNEGLSVLFEDRPVRVIIARDNTRVLKVLYKDVFVWQEPERVNQVSELEMGNKYRLEIVDWPITNAKGVIMIPVYWKDSLKQVGWINYECLELVS